MAKTPAGQDPVYMGPADGPFKCGNCDHYVGKNRCDKAEMMKKQKRTDYAVVQAEGCCNYYIPCDDDSEEYSD